jgi:hypothetical protein
MRRPFGASSRIIAPNFTEITAFVAPEAFPRFGLPEELACALGP